MKKIMYLKDDGFNFVCRFDDHASEKPFRLYLSAYVLRRDGIARHSERQVGRFDGIADVLHAIARYKEREVTK